MTDQTQRVAALIMAHVYNWTDGKDNIADIKFGRRSLLSMLDMIDDTIKPTHMNVALDWLIENNHIKKLGGYIYGLGTGKGLKRLKVDKTYLMPTASHGFNNSNIKHVLDNKAAAPTIASTRKKTTVPAKTKVSPNIEPATLPKESYVEANSTQNQKLKIEMDALRSRLATPERQTIKDKTIKLSLLNELSAALEKTEPTTARLLNQIKHDLQQGEAA